MEPKIKIDGEHSTMAADGLLDPAAACAARRASACLSWSRSRVRTCQWRRHRRWSRRRRARHGQACST